LVVDPIKDFLSIEERMLLRATGKLEAEKAILARKQFDLSSLSAEVDLKSIMETLTKLPKEGLEITLSPLPPPPHSLLHPQSLLNVIPLRFIFAMRL
jgi:hypothetical protein